MVEYDTLPPGRNPPPPEGSRPEPPKSPPNPKKVSEFIIVYGEFQNLAGYVSERLKNGWRLRGRVRKKIGNTYYQVMVK